MSSILSIQHISKSYGPIQALKDVSFDVPEGCVFGILGPNGSGKTTMLGIVLDVLLADVGNYSWYGGMEHSTARKQIGALLETPNFYHYLSAFDNLEINAAIKQRGHDDRDQVLKQVGLYERKDSKFQTFSLGMKQRLAIGAALLGNPKILVLDEPTNGLDPAGIAEIRELIRQLNKQGITIIIASHMLDEIEKVCTHVAILKKGTLLLHGPVDEVLLSEDQVEVRADNTAQLQQALEAMPGIKKIKLNDNTLQLTCDATVTTAQVNAYCTGMGITLSHLLLRKKSLETKFMELTNQ
ncbi:MAG: transporter ATP-binding protein [Flavipsychrobacter sp.]|nr:transporter ATP-binding protein [Flavipsychrobacter sp.]